MPANALSRILPRIEQRELEFRKYSNLLIALLDRRERASHASARPFEITLDLTTQCQLSCPYCEVGNGTMERSPSLLAPETHERMMSQLADETFIIWYFSTGEPLLNKRLPEIVAQGKSKEIFSVISTNLSMPLSDARIDDILTCGLSCISVSCDGASAETYVQYRRGGDFELVASNMRRLVERKRALDLQWPLIEWRFLVFRHNEHELKKARRLAKAWGLDLFEVFPGYAPPDAPVEDVRPATVGLNIGAPSEGPALAAASGRRDTLLHKRLSNDWELPTIPPTDLRGRKCDWLYFGSMLYPNGSVGPCCVSNHESDDFGSLEGEGRFEDVWNNAQYVDARRLFGETDHTSETICQRCPMPDSQDFTFRTTLRAVLRNAPDWALVLLTDDLNRFFHPIDRVLIRDELEILRNEFKANLAALDDVTRWHASAWAKRPEDPVLARFAEVLDAVAGAGTTGSSAAHP